jgi:two-component system nitrogen regulation response regulator GlnG
VFQIHLPPLRERREDILPLAEHFLGRLEPTALPLLPATASFLTNLPWLGNVRELRNALEHAVILARGGPLLPDHFPAAPGLSAADAPARLAAAVIHWLQDRLKAAGGDGPHDLYQQLLNTVEPPLLEELMRRLQGNRWAAAQWLGLNRATVRKKLTQYGLADIHKDTDDEEEKP